MADCSSDGGEKGMGVAGKVPSQVVTEGSLH